MKIAIVPEQATIYRVRYHGPNGERRYRTLFDRDKAVDLVAWWMIFDKYNSLKEIGEWLSSLPEYKPKHRPPFDCACKSADEYGPEWVGCPLHDRDTGYYARLHERVVRMLRRGENHA
jgi:hypothetical protein